MELRVQCDECDKCEIVKLTEAQELLYKNGGCADDIFPATETETLSILKTGLCTKCYDKMFSDDAGPKDEIQPCSCSNSHDC